MFSMLARDLQLIACLELGTPLTFILFFFRILFIYLTEHKQAEWQVEGEGEAGSPISREPDKGLDPRTLGSRPEPKVDAQLMSHPGAPGDPI